MARKVEEKVTPTEPKYKGSQLLRLDEYKDVVSRVVIDPEAFYTIAEIKTARDKILNTKG